MSFVIKVCGITNEADALAATDAGANAVGFNFYSKSKRAISLEAAHRIAARLPDSVTKVGVFVEPSIEEVLLAIDQVRSMWCSCMGGTCLRSLTEPGARWRLR